MPDSLVIVTAADSASVAAGVASLVAGWGVPAQIVQFITDLLLSLPTIAVVMLTRVPVFQWFAPTFHAWLDPVWNRNKPWLLPVLAMLAGYIGFHNPLVGALAVALHQAVTGIAKAAKGTSATVAAGRVGVVLLAVGALSLPVGARTAQAASAGGLASLAVTDSAGRTLPILSVHRLVATVAFGEGWDPGKWSGTPASYARWNVGYQVFPFLQITGGARRPFVAGSKWSPEAEARIIFAP